MIASRCAVLEVCNKSVGDQIHQRTTKVSRITNTVSHDIAFIIHNQPPFSAGSLKQCVHAWTEITSDPFILDAVTHCYIGFDVLPDSDINKTKLKTLFHF